MVLLCVTNPQYASRYSAGEFDNSKPLSQDPLTVCLGIKAMPKAIRVSKYLLSISLYSGNKWFTDRF